MVGLPSGDGTAVVALINTTDPEGDPLTYGFRVYADELCTQPLLTELDLYGVTDEDMRSIGEIRTLVRLVLPDDEDAATDALARLHASGDDTLGGDTRLLGAFRACGLLVPVWDLAWGTEAEELEKPVAELAARLEEALAVTEPLTANERRARAGLVARQLTLR